MGQNIAVINQAIEGAANQTRRATGTTKRTVSPMKNPFIFVSTCPGCGQQRLQHGHTRRALIRSIEVRQIIDAYCLECDMVWAVTLEDRGLIACALATGQSSMEPGWVAGLINSTQQRQQAVH
jgi:hypothetical protein